MVEVEIDGESLSLASVVDVARRGATVRLAQSARTRMTESRSVVERALRDGRVIYGVNTGFGELSRVSIGTDDLASLQVNLVRSHSAGVGEPLRPEIVRCIMLLRANALAKGFSGVRVELVEKLLELLNHGVLPIIPEKGSVGSSGDLAPLAHMGLVMIGEGKAMYRDKVLDGRVALSAAGIEPIALEAKEGVSLINGTQPMTAIGALAVNDAMDLIRNACVAASLSLEALRGTRVAFDHRIHSVRPHRGQNDIARVLLDLLRDSEINRSHANCGKVQDAYSLRCIPQVLGAVLDTVRYVRSVIETEINSATDNPLVFPTENAVLSGGNFHGEPVALAMDFLGIALSELANIAERRINRLVDPKLSELPAFLTRSSGLQSGLMIAQYTAASLVSENKVLAHPASVDSIPTSGEQEDHVSMGTIAAVKADKILQNAKNVVAIEYLCAAQGVDLLSPLTTSEPLQQAMQAIREKVPLLETDRVISEDIGLIRSMMEEGRILGAVESITGPILRQ